MTLDQEHEEAVKCLPVDGRWQTVAQLVGHTRWSRAKVRRIYRDLQEAGFIHGTQIPIAGTTCRMTMFCCRWFSRMRFYRALKYQRRFEGNNL